MFWKDDYLIGWTGFKMSLHKAKLLPILNELMLPQSHAHIFLEL